MLDTEAVLRDRARFSARAAGVLGFSVFSSDTAYALDADMDLDLATVERFAERHGDGPVLLYGFTYIIWQSFLAALERRGVKLALPRGILIHGGGWKKLTERAVSADAFRDAVREWTGVPAVREYYGMAEQTGSIFLECEHGHLHASVWSDVLLRDPRDFSVCAPGAAGLIEVLSPLPRSYPGHCLLTEDLGVLLGEDDCSCGHRGQIFQGAGARPPRRGQGVRRYL